MISKVEQTLGAESALIELQYCQARDFPLGIELGGAAQYRWSACCARDGIYLSY